MVDLGAEFLFQVIAERAEKATAMITTIRLCGAQHSIYCGVHFYAARATAGGAFNSRWQGRQGIERAGTAGKRSLPGNAPF